MAQSYSLNSTKNEYYDTLPEWNIYPLGGYLFKNVKEVLAKTFGSNIISQDLKNYNENGIIRKCIPILLTSKYNWPHLMVIKNNQINISYVPEFNVLSGESYREAIQRSLVTIVENNIEHLNTISAIDPMKVMYKLVLQILKLSIVLLTSINGIKQFYRLENVLVNGGE